MNPVGLAAAVGCSVAFTLFDASRKQLVASIPVLPLLVLLMLGQAALLWALWAFNHPPHEAALTIAPDYWPLVVTSIALNIGANSLFLLSVRMAPLSMAIPMLSISPLFAALGEFLWTGQTLTLQQALGMGGIIIATLGLSRCAATDQYQPSQSPHHKPLLGMACMVVVSLLWATASVVDKQCLPFASPFWHGAVLYTGIGVAALIATLVTKQFIPLLGLSRHQQKWLGIALLAAATSTLLQFGAISLIPVGIVEATKRGVGLVGALVLGCLLFAEKITPTQLAWVGALLLFVGLLT